MEGERGVHYKMGKEGGGWGEREARVRDGG